MSNRDARSSLFLIVGAICVVVALAFFASSSPSPTPVTVVPFSFTLHLDKDSLPNNQADLDKLFAKIGNPNFIQKVIARHPRYATKAMKFSDLWNPTFVHGDAGSTISNRSEVEVREDSIQQLREDIKNEISYTSIKPLLKSDDPRRVILGESIFIDLGEKDEAFRE